VEPRDGSPATAAVVVNVTGDALPAVQRYLADHDRPVGAVIHLSVPVPGRDAISSAGDLVAIADAVRAAVHGLSVRPDVLWLFYWGPAAGAVFIGHALNAVAPRVQLFEEVFGRYEPSIIL
jgi:hypothetical protein